MNTYMSQSGLLPAYLLAIGFDALAVGIMETATLLGSATMALAVGSIAARCDLRTLFRSV